MVGNQLELDVLFAQGKVHLLFKVVKKIMLGKVAELRQVMAICMFGFNQMIYFTKWPMEVAM